MVFPRERKMELHSVVVNHSWDALSGLKHTVLRARVRAIAGLRACCVCVCVCVCV